MIILIGAVLPLIWISSGIFGSQSDRVGALDHDRLMLDEITRAVRQAESVVQVTPQRIELTTGDAAVDPVVFDCSEEGSEPDRYLCARSDSNGGYRELIDGVSSSAPFSVDPERQYVRVHLAMTPSGGERDVSLAGGATVRASTEGPG